MELRQQNVRVGVESCAGMAHGQGSRSIRHRFTAVRAKAA